MANDWEGLIGGQSAPAPQPEASGWDSILNAAPAQPADTPIPSTPGVARPWTQDLQAKLDANKRYSGQDFARDVLGGKIPADQVEPGDRREKVTPELLKKTTQEFPSAVKQAAKDVANHPKETLANAADLALTFTKMGSRPLVAETQLSALVGGTLGGGLGVALAGGGLKAVGKGMAQGFQDAASSFVLSPFSHSLDPMSQGVINGAIGDTLNWIANYKPEQASVTDPTAEQRLNDLKAAGTMVLPVVLPAALMVGAHMAARTPVTPELLSHAERIKYRIDDAVKKGVATQEAADFAKKVIDKNPHVVRGLGVNAVPQKGVAGGAYEPESQLVELYGLAGQSGRLGVVHEVLHHVERMLPPNVREGLLFAYDAGLRGLTSEQAQWVKDYRTLQQGGNKDVGNFTPEEHLAATRLKAAAEAGKDPRSFYRFTNPSEFWAESGSEMLDRRWASGWQAAGREFVNGIADSLKGNDQAKVRAALKAMGRGDGTFQSNEMLHEQMQNWGLGGSVFRSHAYQTMIGLEGLKNLMGQERGQEFHDELLGGLILGKDPLEIWREKLAWEGPDGQLHKAISDSGSIITPQGEAAIEAARAGNGDQHHILGAIFDHPMLYTAYPNLEFADVEIGRGGGTYMLPPDGEGQMFPKIRLDLSEEQAGNNPRSVILHEVQHAIQEVEKWARGGSSEEFIRAGWSRKLAKEAYMRLAGEVEARYTQATRDVSGEGLRKLYPPAVMEHGGYPVGKQIVLGPYDEPASPYEVGLTAKSRALFTMHDDLNNTPAMTPLEEELMRASGASDEQIAAVKAGRSMADAPVQGKYRGYGHAGNILDILRQKEEAAAKAEKRPAVSKPRYKVQVNPDGTSTFVKLEDKTGTDESSPGTWENLLQNASQDHQNGPGDSQNSPEGGYSGKTGTGPQGPTFESKQSSQSSNAPTSGASKLDVPESVYKDIRDVLNKMQAATRQVNNALHALEQTVPEKGVRESIVRRWMGDTSKLDRRTLSVAHELEAAFDSIGRKAEAAGERAALNENFFQRALNGGLGVIKPELRKAVKTANIRGLFKIAHESGARLINEDVGNAFRLYSEAYTRATLQKGLIEYLKHPDLGLAWKVGKYGRAPDGWQPVPSVSWAGYLVHPDLVPALKFVFDQTEPGTILKGAYLVGQTAKRIGVVGSLFHAMSLFQSAWASVGPVWAVKEVGLGVMDRMLKTRMSAITRGIDLYKTGGLGDKIDLLIKAGLKFDMNEDATTGLLHTLGNGLDGFISHMTGKDVRAAGNVARAVEDRTLGYFDRFTWDFMHTGLKAGVSLKLLEDTMRKNPGADEAQVAQEVAKFVNSAFGGLNWYQVATDTTNHTIRNLQLGLYNRSGRMVLQTLFFAPDWTISTWKNFTSAFKREGSVKGLINPLTRADFARRYQLRTIITYLTLLNGINIAMSGKPIWQNKDPFRLEFADGTTMAPMKHAAEPFEWLKDPIKVFSNKLGFIPKLIGKTTMGDYRVPPSKRALKELRSLVPFQLESGIEAKQGDTLSHILWGEIGLPVYGHPKTSPNKFSTP